MATQSKPKPTKTKVAAPKKPRLSAAERRVLEAEEHRKAVAAFEVARPTIWAGYWVRALEIALRGADDDEFCRKELDDFEVDLNARSIKIGYLGQTYTEASLAMSGHEEIDWRLAQHETAYKTLVEEREERRRQEEHRAQLRASGRQKLTDEEADALGIRG